MLRTTTSSKQTDDDDVGPKRPTSGIGPPARRLVGRPGDAEQVKGHTDRMIESPFSLLSAYAVRALVDASRLRRVDAGAVVFAEGDPGGSLLLISSGLVAIRVRGASRAPLTVAVRGPGEMLGETALFARADRRTATGEARAASRFLELDAVAFGSLRAAHPEVDDLFLRILAERSASLTRRLAESADVDPRVRLARRLLDLPVGATPESPLPVTVDDLAGLSGLSHSQVAAELAEMQTRGWVGLVDGVAVLNRPVLVKLSGWSR
jgi:CRP/FNR family transcriptional regulator, cyclic AMP receptor protein